MGNMVIYLYDMSRIATIMVVLSIVDLITEHNINADNKLINTKSYHSPHYVLHLSYYIQLLYCARAEPVYLTD